MPLREILALPVLPRDFYARPAVEVARLMLGQILVHGRRAGRITEVEAYLGEHDLAAHVARGRTGRTEVIYGPPGHAYVYFIYGMHDCLNVVTEPEGSPGCVLIRALEPLCGIELMRRESPSVTKPFLLCSGPGRLTRAMRISRRHYGADLTAGPIVLRQGPEVEAADIVITPRIGVRLCADWPLRFFIRGNPSVSRFPPNSR